MSWCLNSCMCVRHRQAFACSLLKWSYFLLLTWHFLAALVHFLVLTARHLKNGCSSCLRYVWSIIISLFSSKAAIRLRSHTWFSYTNVALQIVWCMHSVPFSCVVSSQELVPSYYVLVTRVICIWYPHFFFLGMWYQRGSSFIITV